jgi:hypothetical protein
MAMSPAVPGACCSTRTDFTRELSAVVDTPGKRTQTRAMIRLVRLPIALIGILTCISVSPDAREFTTIPRPQSTRMPRPRLPVFDWNACPFEGCVYRRWKAEKPVALYDTWNRTRQQMIGRLAAGDKVIGVTGVVITFKPGIIRMDRDYSVPESSGPTPAPDLVRGDILLTYAYRGEGFSAVWFNGTYFSDFDISFTKWPNGGGCGGAHCAATYVEMGRKEWWAKVKLESGRTAWVHMDDARFSGINAIAAR